MRVGQILIVGSASACDESYDGKEEWLTLTEFLWSLLVQCWFVIWDVASQFLYQIIQVWQVKLLTGAVMVWCTSSNTKEWLWSWGHLHHSWWNEPDWTKQSRMSVIHKEGTLTWLFVCHPYQLSWNEIWLIPSRKYSLGVMSLARSEFTPTIISHAKAFK